MSGSVNKVIIIGNLGRDPEVRTTQAGEKIVNLRVATSESWRDKSTGERREKSEWHSVVIFNDGLAKVAEQYLRKGSKVYIEGQLQTRKWQDQSGADRYSTEIVLQRYRGELTLLDGPKGGGEADEPEYAPAARLVDSVEKMRKGVVEKPTFSGGAMFDDDIPFVPCR